MMFALFSIAVAAAEAAVGWPSSSQSIATTGTTELDKMNRMKG